MIVASTSSEGSCEPVRMRSLARVFASRHTRSMEVEEVSEQ